MGKLVHFSRSSSEMPRMDRIDSCLVLMFSFCGGRLKHSGESQAVSVNIKDVTCVRCIRCYQKMLREKALIEHCKRTVHYSTDEKNLVCEQQQLSGINIGKIRWTLQLDGVSCGKCLYFMRISQDKPLF